MFHVHQENQGVRECVPEKQKGQEHLVGDQKKAQGKVSWDFFKSF